MMTFLVDVFNVSQGYQLSPANEKENSINPT
jgi:hypothetical protein